VALPAYAEEPRPARTDGPRPAREAIELGALEMRIPPRPVPAAYRHAPLPRYPTAAREQGLEGVVVLSVLIRQDGRVDDARVAISSGAIVLDQAALAAVRAWLFAPATQGGRPVESVVEVPVKFALRSP
jgi:protein TonB